MREKIIGILICMMMFSTVAVALSQSNMQIESSDNKIESNDRSYTHTVLGEYGTMTTCVPCKYAHRALKYLYQNRTLWDLPFYYITYVYDKNNWSYQRMKVELDLQASPTLFWDGGWKKDIGSVSVESAMDKYNVSIRAAAARTVKDIDINLNVEWLGAVNEVPSNGATGVPVEQIMRWNNSEFKIDVEVICNETGGYNGHLHVQVTEVESEWYDDHFGDPETFEFKDYAYNDDVTFSGPGTWTKTIYWDGCEHHDKDSPPRYFNHIKQDNIMVFATIFNEDNNNYADEATAFLAGEGTDPKLYDIYFGKNQTPPVRLENFSQTKFNNQSLLEFDTTYYWKIDTWDHKDNLIQGDVWNFKTRGNNPPNEPSAVYPPNNETDVSINANLSWTAIDPDFDTVTYDVYFGEGIGDPPLVKEDHNTTTYDPTGNFNFLTPYRWKIVARDQYGYESEGEVWNFKTEKNYPPNIPSNPDPADGQTGVNIESNISWTGGDPNDGDTVTYDVYFGVTNPPTLKSSNQTKPIYDPVDPLIEYKKYYWYIISWDAQGEQAIGPLWYFETGTQEPPTAPDINGPDMGSKNIEYEFTFVSIDPNNDKVRYFINWGDGNTEWTDFYDSGVVVNANHTWNNEKEFTITSKAQDEFDLVGPETEKKIRIPRSKFAVLFNPLYKILERLFYHFPIMQQLLGL
jgi:hypothetical protein